MRKLFITCDCGQQMQVPRSAVGKMGQCPSCGEKIPINRSTTSNSPQARPSVNTASRTKWGTAGKPSIDAKQQFGRAVDLYCAGNYGEALAIFNSLQAEFPDSTEIQRARRQCLEARNRDPLTLPDPGEGQIAGDELDDATLRSLRRIVVAKMLHGSTDAVQLQAAELLARMAGILNPQPPKPAEDAEDADKDADQEAEAVDADELRGRANGASTNGENGHARDANEDFAAEIVRDEGTT